MRSNMNHRQRLLGAVGKNSKTWVLKGRAVVLMGATSQQDES